MKKGDRQVGNEWIYLGVLQRIGFDQLSWKDDGLRRRGTARQRIPAVSTANAMVETVCFWLLQRVGVRPDFALPLYWSGCCFEYLEWAGAAPCSEPGQVREEAAIRDRWRAPLPIRDTCGNADQAPNCPFGRRREAPKPKDPRMGAKETPWLAAPVRAAFQEVFPSIRSERLSWRSSSSS